MSTIRNYPFVKKNYNTFLGCYDEVKSQKYPITKELKWLLEEDMNNGAQILADTSKKMVELSLNYELKDNSHLFSKKPKKVSILIILLVVQLIIIPFIIKKLRINIFILNLKM